MDQFARRLARYDGDPEERLAAAVVLCAYRDLRRHRSPDARRFFAADNPDLRFWASLLHVAPELLVAWATRPPRPRPRRRPRLVAAAALMIVSVLAGCVSRRPLLGPTAAPPEPDVRPTTLFTYRGLAQGCPVEAQLILSARHVVDRPPSEGGPLEWVAWGQAPDAGGYATVVQLDRARDLVALRPERSTAYQYPAAPSEPQSGEAAWLAGYDLRRGLEWRVVRTRVRAVVAGHLILEDAGGPGLSGSCVWDARGQVIGIYQWRVMLSDGAERGIASAWGGRWTTLGGPGEGGVR